MKPTSPLVRREPRREPSPASAGHAAEPIERRLPLVAVVGPTASGKSALALELAERLGGEVLSTDSMQVYRGLDIGTGKPGTAERARVPHHLIDTVAPDETYSAGRYLADARRVLADLERRGRAPVLCGGTGLYFRALLRGLAPVPEVPAEVRAGVEREAETRGLAACHEALRRADPEAAARLHPRDRQRILRALEVYRATGTPLSEFQRRAPFRAPARNVLWIGPARSREALGERIAGRVRGMLAAGWIDEVEALRRRGYSLALKPLRAIGYREIGEHLAGRRPREGLAEAITVRTRQYAKRQRTWFRRQPDILWAPPEERQRLIEAAEAFLHVGPAGAGRRIPPARPL